MNFIILVMNINGTILTIISVLKNQILFSIFFQYYFDIFSMVFFIYIFRLKVNSIFCRIRCVDVLIFCCFDVLTFRCFVFRCLVWHPCCKQYGPRSDCSIWSSLIRVKTVCFHGKKFSLGCLCTSVAYNENNMGPDQTALFGAV